MSDRFYVAKTPGIYSGDYARDARRAALGAYNFAGGNLASYYTGDPNAETWLGRNIPAAVQALAANLPTFAQIAYNFVSDQTGGGMGQLDFNDVPGMEWVDTANKHIAGAQQEADRRGWVLRNPEVDPTGEVATAGSMMGMIAVGAGLPMGLLSNLPRYARIPGHVLAPNIGTPKLTAGEALIGPSLVTTVMGDGSEHKPDAIPDIIWNEQNSQPTQAAQAAAPEAAQVQATIPPTNAPPKLALTPTQTPLGDISFATTPVTEPALSFTQGETPNPAAHGVNDQWTYGDVALATLGVGAAVAGGRYLRTLGWRLSEAGRGRAGAQFNAELDAMRRQDNLMVNAGEVPAMPTGEPGLNKLDEARNKLYNSSAQMQAVARESAQSAVQADKLEAAIGLTNDPQLMNKRIERMILTGIDPKGNTVPKSANFYRAVDQLDDRTKQLFEAGWYALDELDNRKILARQLGVSVDDPSARHGLWTQSNQALQADALAMYSSPEATAMYNWGRSIKKATFENLRDNYGYITPDEFNNLMRERPNHLSSVDAEGRLLHAFGERELKTQGGPAARTVGVLDRLAQQEEALYARAIQNETNRAVVEARIAAQNANPRMPVLFEERPASPAGGRQEQMITIRSATGQKTYYVHNADIHKTMTSFGETMPLWVNTTSWLTHAYQSLTTGPWAVLGGMVFAPRNLLRGMSTMATEAPVSGGQRSYSGVLDMLARKATGERVGIPGVDYAAAPVTLPAYALYDASMQGARVMANFLDPQNGNRINTFLRAYLSNAVVDKMAQRAMQVFEQSSPGAFYREGLSGMGARIRSAVEVQGRIGGLPTKITTPAAAALPEVFRANGMSWGIRANQLMHEINNWVSDLPHRQYYALNRMNPNVTPEANAFNTLRLTGAPGRTGASPIAQMVGRTTPFLNPAIQGTGMSLRQLQEQPVQYIASKIMKYGTISLATTMMLSASGSDHVQHYETMVTPAQKARGILIPGANPGEYVNIPIPQQDEVIWSLVDNMVKTVVGLEAAGVDDEHRKGIASNIADMFHSYIAKDTLGSMRTGVEEGIMPANNLGPIANAIGAFSGQTIQPGRMVFGESPLVPQRTIHDLPGQQTDDALFGNASHRNTFNQVLSATLGLTGATISAVMGEARKADSLEGGLYNAEDAWTQAFKDNNAWGNDILWANKLRASVDTTTHKSFIDAIRKIDAVGSGNPAREELNRGYTGRGGEPIAVVDASRVPTDPTMQQLFMMTGQLRHNLRMKGGPLDERGELIKQRGHLDNINISMEAKRESFNALVEKQHSVERKALDIIRQYNTSMSQLVGGYVDVRTIDWAKGPEQFVKLTAPQQPTSPSPIQ